MKKMSASVRFYLFHKLINICVNVYICCCIIV